MGAQMNPMRIEIAAELEATESAHVWLTPENLVTLFSDPWSRPFLTEMRETRRVSSPDGYVKFYLRATVEDRTDAEEIMSMSLFEVCDLFEQENQGDNRARRV